MPLTPIQKTVLQLLAANRNPESYLAGATVLHQAPDSPRSSRDLDFFHDVAEAVAQCAEADAEVLLAHGAQFEWLMRTPTFYRGLVALKKTSLKLEWAQDSAFRFFPVQRDKACGYRLHIADAATNKILALAGRQEVRDYVDVLHLDKTYLSLGALVWAACGKDPGYTPDFLLDQLNRHTCYTQEDLSRLDLSQFLSIQNLKHQWLTAREMARELMAQLPPENIGCLFLDERGNPVTPNSDRDISGLQCHWGSISGAWPNIL